MQYKSESISLWSFFADGNDTDLLPDFFKKIFGVSYNNDKEFIVTGNLPFVMKKYYQKEVRCLVLKNICIGSTKYEKDLLYGMVYKKIITL